ncbi:DUF523 domain-containing protein [Acinetobacter wanghuae]|uniref:DUF523 domain-containing protein n=1 Tax=Acinetobacter wanghuae TaxID=2662362 RepID=UPI003AF68B27
MSKRYFISACLLGQKVRYDGKDCLIQDILNHLLAHQYVTLCPEMAGGLPTPRQPAEIQHASGINVLEQKALILDVTGKNVSEAFIDGAYCALKAAQDFQVTHAILKAKSPSCGSGLIYDGAFSGQKILGDGVTAALFKQHGIVVLTEDEFLRSLRRPSV